MMCNKPLVADRHCFLVDWRSSHSSALTNSLLTGTASFLAGLCTEYPNFQDWFSFTFMRGFSSGERKIIILTQGNTISGAALLKDTHFEKKICTLRVSDDNQKQGIGSKLMEISFEVLKTQSPLITVSTDHIHEFSKILCKYSFELCDICDSYYRLNSCEYTYNGFLKNNKKAFYIPVDIGPNHKVHIR